MVGSFSSVFGGSPVAPAQPTLLELTMASSIVLSWPTDATGTPTYFATTIDVTASIGGLTLTMPSALVATPGRSSLISNVGLNTFNLLTNTGTLIAVIPPGQQWLVYLYDNTTQGGLWRAVQIGATTSTAQAAALAGAGLLAALTKLNVSIATVFSSNNTTLLQAHQANLLVWQGAVGTVVLDTAANLGIDWWAAVSNEGTGALTISGTGGQTINGQASITLQPGFSAVIVCTIIAGVGSFNTFANTPSPVPVAGGGTGASTAAAALVNLSGTTTGISIFTAPSVAAVLALLGITSTVITESTVAVNQTLNAGSTQTAFVCTAALTLNLPLTTGLTKNFVFYAYAQGGNVTIHPNVADAINGAAAGVNFPITTGSSALFVTDAAGNWWPFFIATSGTVTSVALTMPGEFVVGGSPVATSGTLAVTKANQNANLVYAGPGAGGAAAPTFRALVAADIPGSVSVTSIADAANGGLNFSAATGAVSAKVDPSNASAKATPVLADTLLLGDSAAAFALKAITLTALQAAIAPASLIGMQVFTSSGTYTPTPGTAAALVFCQGPGGGGAGGTAATLGGGGGAGGLSIKAILAGVTAQTVTVPAGAAGGVNAQNGFNGNTTSFGAICSATGGSGGRNDGVNPFGGNGGVGSGGTINLTGGTGFGINTGNFFAAGGIPAFFGGATGTGGTGNQSGGNGNGGVGAGGCIMVFEFG